MESTELEIYSSMLTLQAEMAYPFERPLYNFEYWSSARNVLDFGCGNGHYLSLLKRSFPDKSYFAVELESGMRAKAAETAPFLEGLYALDQIPSILPSIDVFLFRLVMMHLKDRSVAYDLVHKIGAQRAAVVVVEAEDRHFAVSPPPQKFLAGLMALRTQAVDRAVADTVAQELEQQGFRQIERLEIVVNSAFPHARWLMAQYMYLSASLGAKGRLDPEIANELLEWSTKAEAYCQYGVVASAYQRA
jgi:SAM-dependent methyltransferase